MDVRLSARAEGHLVDIWSLVATHNGEPAADRVLDRLSTTIQRLGTFPRAGRARVELDDASLLVFPRKPWLIIYELDDLGVSVLAVVHGAQNLTRVSRHLRE
ncbi:MAG: type II toxin-antitoxin system RelE/ParE family toxin [Chloroflexi bacterium]|nr:type II toxin-antitoxin system RelE/ParE family toxin [Chloroflexota bacterium]